MSIELIDSFIEDVKKTSLSLTSSSFNYRGFGSQGDGLSFDFKVQGIHECNLFLDGIGIDSGFHLYEISDVVIYTFNNSFATRYCHEKTRNISVYITSDDDWDDIAELVELVERLEKEIESWYYNICQEFYRTLENNNNEIEELEELEEDRQEWDDNSDGPDSTGNTDDLIDDETEEISSAELLQQSIELMIKDREDPDMLIENVISMVEEARTLSNNSNEHEKLIKAFIKNFNKEYMIIKKVN